jgi:Uma2 family endonuclease
MSAKAGISVEEYLHTSFPDLDREYRNGELVERSLPDYFHARTQALLNAYFEALRKRLPVYTCSELRVKLREGLYLIPDVTIFWPSKPLPLPELPPLIAIEILSPDDRLASVREKLEEYKAWGAPHVWLADPHARRLYTCVDGFREVASFTVPELGVTVTPNDIFE